MTRLSQQYPPELRERAVRMVMEVTPNAALFIEFCKRLLRDTDRPVRPGRTMAPSRRTAAVA
jgi:hypothetical protein